MKKNANKNEHLNSIQSLWRHVFKGIGWIVLGAILTSLYLLWKSGVRNRPLGGQKEGIYDIQRH